MLDRMSDRCKRICGTVDNECYINSKNQLRCIIDMVINNTSTITMTLGFSLDEDSRDAMVENMKLAINSSNELSNWIKFLQLMGDLKKLSSLVLDSDAKENRTEIRYPMTVPTGKITVYANGAHGDIINYSQSGVKFYCSEPLEPGTSMEADLVLNIPQGKKVPIVLKVAYCIKSEDNNQYIAGAQLQEVYGSRLFNFFNEVHHMIMDLRWVE